MTAYARMARQLAQHVAAPELAIAEALQQWKPGDAALEWKGNDGLRTSPRVASVRWLGDDDGGVCPWFEATCHWGDDGVARTLRVELDGEAGERESWEWQAGGVESKLGWGELGLGESIQQALEPIASVMPGFAASGLQASGIGMEYLGGNEVVRSYRFELLQGKTVGSLHLEDASLTVLVVLEDGVVCGTQFCVQGDVLLGKAEEGVRVRVELGLPELEFRGNLTPGQKPLSLRQLMGILGAGSELWPDGLQLEQLQLEYAPKEDVRRFTISLAGDWEPLPGIGLLDLHAEVLQEAGETRAALGASFRLFARTVDEIEVEIEAELQRDEEGHRLSMMGSVEAGGQIPLGLLVEDALRRTGTGIELPSALVGTRVSELGLELESVRLEGMEKTQTVLGLDFTVGATSGDWDVVPGMLAFSPARISLTFGSGGAALDIREMVSVFGSHWMVELEVPHLRGSLSLADAECEIGKALGHFHLPVHGLDGLKLTNAQASFDAKAKTGTLHLELAEWRPELWLDLQRVSFDVAWQGGEKGGSTAELTASLELFGDVRIDLRANHPGAGLGWNFQGSLSADRKALSLRAAMAPFQLEFVADNLGLADTVLESLDVAYDTATRELTLGAVVRISAAATIRLDLERLPSLDGGGIATRVGGSLLVNTGAGEIEFDLLFRKDAAGSHLLASYSDPGGGHHSIDALIGALSDGAVDLPAGLTVRLKDALLVYDKSALHATSERRAGAKLLLAFDLDAGVDLSGLGQLPLIGKAFSGADHLRAAFTPVVATKPFTAQEIEQLSSLLPAGAPHLPSGGVERADLQVSVQVGDTRWQLPEIQMPASSAGMSSSSTEPNPGLGSVTARPKPKASLPPSTANVSWVNVQKTLAKVLTLRRLGVGFEASEQKLTLLLDGSIHVACLEFDLVGLGASYGLRTHELDFALHGIGLDLRKGALEVGAAFVNFDGDFVGRAVVKLPKFGLAALGAFQMMADGSPSMFIYGVLTAPLGGPVFFFVEGLAAGFGYNRHLNLPPISGVRDFPFVAEAVTPPDEIDVMGELEKIHQSIYPSTGEFFFAAGLKFNSFRLVDCFALLSLQIDLKRNHFLIALMGVGSVKVPQDSPVALYFIEIAFLLTIDPMEGVVLLNAELTQASYVYTPQCHIVGGVGVGLWFAGDHAGDYVYSIGGYHPHFPVPAHYPRPVRAGLRWTLSENLWVKGELYCAFTPVAAMAGGRLEALFHCDDITASFVLGADFLVQFKPLHYEADAYLEIHVGFTLLGVHVDVSAGAELELWGPDFAGTAHVHAGPVHFSIDFGATGRHAPPPISWSDFSQSFLPADKSKVLTATISEGLIKMVDQKVGHSISIVNSRKFGLVASTVVPLTALTAKTPDDVVLQPAEKMTDAQAASFGAAPMAQTAPPIHSEVKASVSRDGLECTAEFQFCAVEKAFPAGIWGHGYQSADSAAQINAVGEISIVPRQEPFPGRSCEMLRSNLDYDFGEPHEQQQSIPQRPCVQLGLPRNSRRWKSDRQSLSEALADSRVVKARSRCLSDLGIDPAKAVSLRVSLADAFVVPPSVTGQAGTGVAK